MDSIHKKIGMSGADYAELYTVKYMRWCMSLSKSYFPEEEKKDERMRRDIMDCGSDLQKLMANKSLSLWFKREFDKLELKFLDDLKGYEKLGVAKAQDIMKLYSETMLDIYNIFPKPLLEQARNTKIIEPMKPKEIKETEQKIKDLEKWVAEHKGHTNLLMVVNNIKILQLTLKNATENGQPNSN